MTTDPTVTFKEVAELIGPIDSREERYVRDRIERYGERSCLEAARLVAAKRRLIRTSAVKVWGCVCAPHDQRRREQAERRSRMAWSFCPTSEGSVA